MRNCTSYSGVARVTAAGGKLKFVPPPPSNFKTMALKCYNIYDLYRDVQTLSCKISPSLYILYYIRFKGM